MKHFELYLTIQLDTAAQNISQLKQDDPVTSLVLINFAAATLSSKLTYWAYILSATKVKVEFIRSSAAGVAVIVSNKPQNPISTI